MSALCECGCGAPVRKRFAQGHALRLPEYQERLAATRVGVDVEAARGKKPRNDAIRRRLSAGEAFTDLAIEYGISRQRVEQIFRKQRATARGAALAAVAKGTLVRPSCCERCGQEGTVESHHADYSQPLAVQWLCRLCHAHEDRKRRERHGESRREHGGPALRIRRAQAQRRRRAKEGERAQRRQRRRDEAESRRQDMLYQLAAAALRLGYTPRQCEIQKHAGWSYVSYYNNFGSIVKACHMVGLTPNGIGGNWQPKPIPPNYAKVVDQLARQLSCAA